MNEQAAILPRDTKLIENAQQVLVEARKTLYELSILVDRKGVNLSDELWTVIHELRDQVHELDD